MIGPRDEPVQRAVLVPAGPFDAHRMLTWSGNSLLSLLYRELPGARERGLDAATVVGPGVAAVPGGLRLWTFDDALLREPVEHNDRAIALCRHFGYPVPDLAGPIVFVGCAHGEDEVGLHPRTASLLDVLLARATEMIFALFTEDDIEEPRS